MLQLSLMRDGGPPGRHPRGCLFGDLLPELGVDSYGTNHAARSSDLRGPVQGRPALALVQCGRGVPRLVIVRRREVGSKVIHLGGVQMGGKAFKYVGR